MTAEFISPSDARWRRVLDRVPHDVYHLPEYSALCARHEGGVAVAFYAESGGREFLVPLIEKRLPDGLQLNPEWVDAASPYGYPGPLTTDAFDRAWTAESLAAFRRVARERHMLTAFLRLNPFFGVPPEAMAVEDGFVVEHGPVVYVDLTRTRDELWAETKGNHRVDIKKLLNGGFRATIDDWTCYEQFVELYRATMERVNASAFYFFPDAYFDELRDVLGVHLHLCAVRAPGGEVASAGLFLLTGGVIHYHLGGTANDFRRRAPSKLMMEGVREWGRGIGARILNLGGGIGGRSDSLLQFKAGFSEAHAPFHTVRLVLDPSRYSAIADVVRLDARVSDTDFFPIYRAPRASDSRVAGI